jgi:hypothetical protein
MSRRGLPLWARLCAHWYQDEKLLGRSADSKLMYVQAMGWCRDQLNGGEIPRTALSIVGVDLVGDPAAAAEELVASGAWKRTRRGYRFPAETWDKWQESPEELAEHRAAEAKRLREYRDRLKAEANLVNDDDGDSP